MSERDGGVVVRALQVNAANLALGHELFEAEGATFVRDLRFPDVHDANHVTAVSVSTPEAIERLLARVEREYAHCQHRAFHTDFATPPEFEARLALDGLTREDSLVMLLEGELRAAAKPFDVRPLVDAGGWAEHARLHAADWAEHRPEEAEKGEMLAASNRGKSPPVRYFLGYVDGVARGYFNAWAGIDGVGQVEMLFVEKEYRRRGLATALIARCVAECRAQGAGPVVIVASATDTPKTMYAAMGFRPVALKRNWFKRVTSND